MASKRNNRAKKQFAEYLEALYNNSMLLKTSVQDPGQTLHPYASRGNKLSSGGGQGHVHARSDWTLVVDVNSSFPQ